MCSRRLLQVVCLSAYKGRKEVRRMTSFETIMIILTFIEILVAVIALFIKK